MKSLRARPFLMLLSLLSGGCNQILGIEPATLRGDAGPDGAVSGCEPACQPILEIAAGNAHTCILKNGGDVFCWGENAKGQLGYGDIENRGDNSDEMGVHLMKVDLGTDQRALELALGSAHSCALLQPGQVKCWGGNQSGELGLGDTFNRGDNPDEMGDALPAVDLGPGAKAVHITAGDFHTCALLDSNSIKCWGQNGSGQLGQGDGKPRGDSPSDMGVNLFPVDVGTSAAPVALGAGTSFTCALFDNASVRCWGGNGYGQLGLGDQMARGDNAMELGNFLPSTPLGAAFKPALLASGGGHTCAGAGAGLKCWGRNDAGQLGLSDQEHRGDGGGEMGDGLPEVALGEGNAWVVKNIRMGSRHSCALFDAANSPVLKCWGDNSQGQCGAPVPGFIGDTPNEMGDQLKPIDLGKDAVITGIAAGGSHTCAALAGGRAKCWGDNTSGQLGYGDTKQRGGSAGQMGNALPFITLP